jgi:phage terminase large subunit
VRRETIKYADYRPYGAARELFSQHADEVLLSGPAGTGKSRSCGEKCHAVAEKYPGCRILMARKTRKSFDNTTLVTFEKLVLPRGAAKITDDGVKYPNGSEIVFGGFDRNSKIMGSEYDLAYVAEATELTEDDWEAVTTRLRWGVVPYQQLIADCNPAHPKHWLKLRANSGRTLMLESRHEDNPALWDATAVNPDGARGNWTKKGAAYIAKLDRLTGPRYLRLRKGIWASAEGMIYADWDPAVHMVDWFPIPPDWPRIWVVDFGFSHAFAWQAWARDPDGRLYLYHQICRTKTLVQDHAQAMRNACLGEPYPQAIVCDHDAEDRATLERHLGMYTVPAFKSVRPGIQAVQARLRPAGDGKPRLFVLRDSLVSRDEALVEAHRPTCLEEEIDSYVWAKSVTEGRPKDEPVKKDDDCADCARYAVTWFDGTARDPAEEKLTIGFDARYQISPI